MCITINVVGTPLHGSPKPNRSIRNEEYLTPSGPSGPNEQVPVKVTLNSKMSNKPGMVFVNIDDNIQELPQQIANQLINQYMNYLMKQADTANMMVNSGSKNGRKVTRKISSKGVESASGKSRHIFIRELFLYDPSMSRIVYDQYMKCIGSDDDILERNRQIYKSSDYADIKDFHNKIRNGCRCYKSYMCKKGEEFATYISEDNVKHIMGEYVPSMFKFMQVDLEGERYRRYWTEGKVY